MPQKMNFIKTRDKETAEKLRECGFTEITESGSNFYCFLNDINFTFESTNIDKNKCTYTNTLNM